MVVVVLVLVARIAARVGLTMRGIVFMSTVSVLLLLLLDTLVVLGDVAGMARRIHLLLLLLLLALGAGLLLAWCRRGGGTWRRGRRLHAAGRGRRRGSGVGQRRLAAYGEVARVVALLPYDVGQEAAPRVYEPVAHLKTICEVTVTNKLKKPHAAK